VLWEEGAQVAPTAQADIRIVTEGPGVASEDVRDLVDRMIEAAARDETRVVRLLHECIPSARLTVTPRQWGGAYDPKRRASFGSAGPSV
jgi:hypothetical protein